MKNLGKLILSGVLLTTPLMKSCEDFIEKDEKGYTEQIIYKGENNCNNRFIKKFDTAYASYNIKLDTNLLLEDKGSYVSKLWGYFFGFESPEENSNQLGWHIPKRDSINFTSDSLKLVHYIRDKGKIVYKTLITYSYNDLLEGIELETELSSTYHSHFAKIIDKKNGLEEESIIKTENKIPIDEGMMKSHFYYGGNEFTNNNGDTIKIKALKNLKIKIKENI